MSGMWIPCQPGWFVPRASGSRDQNTDPHFKLTLWICIYIYCNMFIYIYIYYNMYIYTHISVFNPSIQTQTWDPKRIHNSTLWILRKPRGLGSRVAFSTQTQVMILCAILLFLFCPHRFFKTKCRNSLLEVETALWCHPTSSPLEKSAAFDIDDLK